MASEWECAPLSTLVDDILDRRGVTPRKLGSDFVSQGFRVISAKVVKDGRLDLSADEPRFVDEPTYRKWMKGPLLADDVILTSEAPLGEVAYIHEQVDWCLGQRLFCIRTSKERLYGRFLYYALQSESVRHDLYSRATGTTAQGIRQAELRRVVIPVPPLSEQRAIAHILGTLDDKIELNRRMNATLEAIARAIFKSWFVDFDPVHSKARGEQPSGMDAETAALFPDSFEDSELGQIPAGWGVGALSNIADNPRRGIKPEAMDSNTLYIGLEHMPQKSITLDAWGRTSNVASNKFKFRKGEFLFGKLRPYFHKVGIAPDDGVCSTDILVIVPTFEAWYGLTLFHISSKEFIDYTTAASTGTRMPRTNWDTMSKYPIVIPDPKVAEAFSCFLRPLLDTIQNNIWQSRTLAALRDALLPKLISGELRTKELHHVPSTGTG